MLFASQNLALPPSLPVTLLVHAVRLWVGRVAGSLVLGAILGGAIAYFAFPRVLTPSTPTAGADASTNVGSGASASWSASPEQNQQRFQADFGSSGEAGRNFGDRVNRALLAARAGEVAAQQGLLVSNCCYGVPKGVSCRHLRAGESPTSVHLFQCYACRAALSGRSFLRHGEADRAGQGVHRGSSRNRL